MFNLKDWNYDAEYMVIDDIEWKYVPGKKGLIGAQQTITLSDKYVKKMTFSWGKPVIYLCNEDMDVFNTCDEKRWLWENAVYVMLKNKLY